MVELQLGLPSTLPSVVLCPEDGAMLDFIFVVQVLFDAHFMRHMFYICIWSSISFISSNSSWSTLFASLTSCSMPSSSVAQLHTLVVVSFESTLMAQKTPQIYIETPRGALEPCEPFKCTI